MMRSVYSRILLWSLVTLIISMTLFFVISRGIGLRLGSGDPMVKTMTAQLEEARALYEESGRAQVAGYLARMDRVTGWRYFVIDTAGRDIADGTDRSAMVERLRTNSFRPVSMPDGGVTFGIRTADGRYLMVVESRVQFEAWELLPYYGLILLTVAALCWPMAYHIYSPLRRLARTVDRFGQGDLSIRAGSGRRDEIGDLARSFDRMADRIATLLTAERRLLQDVSHELRSPLARLSFGAALLSAEPDRQKAENRIRKEVDRLTALVGSLIEMTRAEGDTAARQMKEVRLDALVGDVAADCSVEAAAHARSIAFHPCAPVTVNGDAEMLRRAVENLLRNAVRYSPEGTTVEVGLACESRTARISVRDYGPGVPPEQLAQIFEPFFRTDEARSAETGGIGLGLAIAKRAVQLHNGRIEARNSAPGLLVTISLPDAAPAAD